MNVGQTLNPCDKTFPPVFGCCWYMYNVAIEPQTPRTYVHTAYMLVTTEYCWALRLSLVSCTSGAIFLDMENSVTRYEPRQCDMSWHGKVGDEIWTKTVLVQPHGRQRFSKPSTISDTVQQIPGAPIFLRSNDSFMSASKLCLLMHYVSYINPYSRNARTAKYWNSLTVKKEKPGRMTIIIFPAESDMQ